MNIQLLQEQTIRYRKWYINKLYHENPEICMQLFENYRILSNINDFLDGFKPAFIFGDYLDYVS